MADIITAGLSRDIDLTAAVIFDDFIIAEDCYFRLWRWKVDGWRPLTAGYQVHASVPKMPNRSPLRRSPAQAHPIPQI